MKKITFFIALMITSLGFAQNLITNGDFSNGTADWIFGAPGVVADGQAYFSTANEAGDPWSTELKQVGKSFTKDISYTLTFRARAAADRKISVNIQNTNIWSDQFRNDNVALTTIMTTFTYTFVAPFTNGDAQLNFHMANMGINTTSAVYIDDVTLTPATVATPTCSDGIKNGDETGIDCGGTSCSVCVTPVPLASALLSTTPDSDVLFLYSDVYASTKVSFANPTWAVVGPSNYSAPSTEVVIAGSSDKIRYFENANVLFMQIPTTDVRAYRYFHMDIWSPNSTFSIVKWEGAGPGLEGNIPVNLVQNQWNSVDIDLDTFGTFNIVANREFMFQLIMDAVGGHDYYFDNLYFSKTPFNLGTSKFETSNVKMFPNPLKNTLTIEANSEIQKVSVYNILGQEVLNASPKSNTTTLQTNQLQKGVYMVTTEIDGKLSTSKVVKE